MIKIRLTYTSKEDREKSLKIIRRTFNIVKISKEYRGKKNTKYASIYIDAKVK